MKELFGKTPAYDYHNPMYLAHTSDLVGAQETENTGLAQVTAQIAVTSRLRATSSRYALSFSLIDCIVLVLVIMTFLVFISVLRCSEFLCESV